MCDQTVHTVRMPLKRNADWSASVLFMSDVHYDNPLCDRDLFHKHMRQAQEIGAKVYMFGDFFCAMNGKYDPRRSKSKVRPEHNVDNYLQALVETAADDLLEYADVLEFISYGNHETAVLKSCEFDLLHGLSILMDYKAKDAGLEASPVKVGSYQGWVRLLFESGKRWSRSVKTKYHHGHGGGGVVTKGTLHPQRRAAWFPDADIFVSGHIHEQWLFPVTRERLGAQGAVFHDMQLHLQSSTYKNETIAGNGWAIEKGMPPKPLGAWWVDFSFDRKAAAVRYSARMAN